MDSLPPTAGEPAVVKPQEPWRRRLVRKLLYGSDIDRRTKAGARIGLAIVAFSLVYAVIAVRLAIFGVTSDPHGQRRLSGQDRVATARPDILDRNGEILSTDGTDERTRAATRFYLVRSLDSYRVLNPHHVTRE